MKPLAPAPPNVHPDARRIPVSAAVLPAGLLCFFALGLLGMVLMMVFALYLSSADPKTN